ncbi:MAG: hypothetical protein M1828_000066 [Chrysothrix sp. TS-e1954]|nr:MAG: hypothetical protein M1828_000066 [Chrysothrix sp. TS-e1954]
MASSGLVEGRGLGDNPAFKGPVRGSGLQALIIIMIILPTVAIFLRIWGRIITSSGGLRFSWDDFFAIIGLPFTLALEGLLLRWLGYGLGHHASMISPADLMQSGKILFGGEFIYDINITLPKASLGMFSALFFYARVFGTSVRPFRYGLYLAHALLTGWIIFALISTIFQCTPVDKAWLTTKPGVCLNYYQWYLGSSISSVILDVYILILPMPMVYKLHTGLQRKLLLVGVFVCAYSVVVISLGRLVAIIQAGQVFEADPTWNTVGYMLWVCTEGSMSIVSICLPSMFQLVKRAQGYGWRSLFTTRDVSRVPPKSSKSGTMGSESRDKDHRDGFERLDGLESGSDMGKGSETEAIGLDTWERSKVAAGVR